MHNPMNSITEAQFFDSVGGFCGALVGLLCTKPMNKIRLLATTAANILTAIYLSPLFVWYFGIPERLGTAISFVTAVASISVLQVAFTWLDKIKENPQVLFSKVAEKMTGKTEND